MSDNHAPYRATTHSPLVSRKARLWPWFAIGFVITFVGMALTINMYTLTASGDGVVACKLWSLYLSEMNRWRHSSGNLGPTSGSSSAAVAMAFQHVLACEPRSKYGPSAARSSFCLAVCPPAAGFSARFLAPWPSQN